MPHLCQYPCPFYAYTELSDVGDVSSIFGVCDVNNVSSILGMCDVSNVSSILGMCDVSDVSSILGMCLEIADVISIQYAHIWACHICAHILVPFMPIYGAM